jgi:hypothetical protein
MSSVMMGWGLVVLFVVLGTAAICIPRFRQKDVLAKPKKRRR